MKISKFLAVSVLAVSTLLAPVKKAEAGLIIGSTPVFLGALGLGVAVWVPAYVRQNSGSYSAFDRVAPGIFLGALAVGLLDANQESLRAHLEASFPSIPSYVIAEASALVADKAAGIEENAQGLKSVNLSAEEFSDLESAIPSSANAEEVEAFKILMTSKVEL